MADRREPSTWWIVWAVLRAWWTGRPADRAEVDRLTEPAVSRAHQAAAAAKLERRVLRSPGRCWFPGDWISPYLDDEEEEKR